MTLIKHVFVYVVDRPDDPFHGLKKLLSQSRFPVHMVSDLRLSPENYACVRKVEYSTLKYFRFLYYNSVFRELDRWLCEATAGSAGGNPCVVYFSDEGVWAEFLRIFRGRHPELALFAVNVQHGFEHRTNTRHRNFRRYINWLSTRLLGFPSFGLGAFGGVGNGVFDVYLTYDKMTSRFVTQRTGDLAFECPTLIKSALLERFKSARQALAQEFRASREIMFALQPSTGNIKGTASDVFFELLPMARLLAEKHGRPLVFRAHPGMEQLEVKEAFHKSGIDRFAAMPEPPELAEQLARCGVVMSYDSTVLWEAYILGLVPVSVCGNCYRGELAFPNETIDVTSGLDAQLEQILRPETAEKYRREAAEEAFNWEAIIVGLVGELALVNSTDAIAHPDSVT